MDTAIVLTRNNTWSNTSILPIILYTIELVDKNGSIAHRIRLNNGIARHIATTAFISFCLSITIKFSFAHQPRMCGYYKKKV